MKKAAFLTLAALTLGLSTVGCIGDKNTFCLFNGVLKWNKTASDEIWINELIFLGLCIIPVYPICLFADSLVFNSIDFWTGENPMSQLVAGTDDYGNTYAITPNGDGTATFTYADQVCLLTPTAQGLTLSQDGVTLGTYTQNGSLVTFTAADGTTRTILR